MTQNYTNDLFKFVKLQRILFLLLLLIGSITSSCSGDGDSTPPIVKPATGSVTGTVIDDSTILSGATVTLKQAGQQDKSVTVGADGVFKFTDLPVGAINLVCSFPLYINQTVQANVLASQITTVQVVMGGDTTILTLIPDLKFEEKLISMGYDVAPANGSVPTYKVNKIKSLVLNDSGVADLTGLQDFTALESFFCSNIYGSSVIKITKIDLSKNTALKVLDLSFNKITTLDISQNLALRSLTLSDNLITNLDVSKLTALTKLVFDRNPASTLDVTKNIALNELAFSGDIPTVDLSKNTALTFLYAYNGKLTSIDVSKNTNLETIWVNGNQLTTLDVSKNLALNTLYCYGNALTNLDVSSNTALLSLSCSTNKLTTLDFSKNTALKELSFSNNQISTLDFSNNKALERLSFSNNLFTSVDISKNTQLYSLDCSHNNLTSLDLSKNPLMATQEGYNFYCGYNQLTTLNLKNGNNVNFKAANFLKNDPTLKIAVDDVAYSNAKWNVFKDATATYVSSF